ncbi:MAG TPA: hypothetical protein PJ986_04120 [Gammaproteobacteria bacterium]|nr:hypothetical protein [Gammaproteobacteria bacterium]
MPRRVRRNRKREPLPAWLAEALRTGVFPAVTDDMDAELKTMVIQWKYFATPHELEAARRQLGVA